MPIRKTINVITDTEADEETLSRLKQGMDLLCGVKTTAQEVSWTRNFRRCVLPFSHAVWGYLRVEDSNVTLGCCGGTLSEYVVMMKDDRGVMHSIRLDREKNARYILTCLEKANPDCRIGYTAENKKYFGITEAK